MNVASLELCKELYELSGWEVSAGFYWYTLYPDHEVAYYKPMYNAKFSEWTEQCPAYDLGHLLRKLPPFIRKNRVGKYFPIVTRTSETDGDTWIADYYGFYDGGWHHKYDRAKLTEDNTPENAACKLAIELFKQGILTREG